MSDKLSLMQIVEKIDEQLADFRNDKMNNGVRVNAHNEFTSLLKSNWPAFSAILKRAIESANVATPNDKLRIACGCIKCLEELPADENRSRRMMVVCSICGNKRCPHATDHRNLCTRSNKPGQPGSIFEYIDTSKGTDAISPTSTMPVFAIKAKDNLAVVIVKKYAKECVSCGLIEQSKQVYKALNEIIRWRQSNPQLCKFPDHSHADAGKAGSGSESEFANKQPPSLDMGIERLGPMGERLNLDHDEARAVHRIVRAMHDGECPNCHELTQADLMHVDDRRNSAVTWSGMRCPVCTFQISDAEADAVLKQFAPYMEQNLAIFEKWRATLKTTK